MSSVTVAPSIRFTSTGDTWLSVDFVEASSRPPISAEFDGLLHAEPGDVWPEVIVTSTRHLAPRASRSRQPSLEAIEPVRLHLHLDDSSKA